MKGQRCDAQHQARSPENKCSEGISYFDNDFLVRFSSRKNEQELSISFIKDYSVKTADTKFNF